MPGDPISRRRFVRWLAEGGLVTGTWAAAATALHNRRLGSEVAAAETLPRYAVDRPANLPRLVVCRGSDVDRMVRGALERLGGVARFIARGDRVVIKPNVAFDRPAVFGATTAPDLVECVARLCFRAGAARVTVVDNPINSNDAEGCFRRTGIGRAAAAAGATVRYPRSWSFGQVDVGGVALRRWPVFAEPLRDATKVIGLAPVKDHNLSHASITMKNWYGLLGGPRAQLHQRIHDAIADLARMIVPTLVIADARRMLVRNGPTGGSVADVKPTDTIIVGADQVAVDACAAGLLGKDVGEITYLANAERRGLGTRNWEPVSSTFTAATDAS